jgi:hypothetical protein
MVVLASLLRVRVNQQESHGQGAARPYKKKKVSQALAKTTSTETVCVAGHAMLCRIAGPWPLLPFVHCSTSNQSPTQRTGGLCRQEDGGQLKQPMQ